MDQFPMNMGYNPYDRNMFIIKNYFKRPIMLAYALVSAIGLVISTALSVIFAKDTAMLFNSIMGILRQYGEEFDAFGTNLNFSFSLSIPIIPILLIVASFIIYTRSKNPNPESKPTAGFTMNWVISILQLVYTVAISVFCIMILLLSIIVLLASEPAAGAIAIVIFILPIAFVALMIVANVNNMRYWASVRKSANGLLLLSKGASFTGVWNIIIAVMSLISAGLVFMFSGFNELGIIVSPGLIFSSSISSVISAVTSLLYGIIALGYNKYIKQQTNNPTFPAAPVYNNPAPDATIGYSYDPTSVSSASDKTKMPNNNVYPDESVMSRNGINMDVSGMNMSDDPFAENENFAPPVQSGMYCPQCGNPVAPKNNFCDKCGYRLR